MFAFILKTNICLCFRSGRDKRLKIKDTVIQGHDVCWWLMWACLHQRQWTTFSLQSNFSSSDFHTIYVPNWKGNFVESCRQLLINDLRILSYCCSWFVGIYKKLILKMFYVTFECVYISFGLKASKC